MKSPTGGNFLTRKSDLTKSRKGLPDLKRLPDRRG